MTGLTLSLPLGHVSIGDNMANSEKVKENGNTNSDPPPPLRVSHLLQRNTAVLIAP